MGFYRPSDPSTSFGAGQATDWCSERIAKADQMLGRSIEFASTESAALHAFGDMYSMYSHNPGGVVNFAIMLHGWGGVGWGINVHVYLRT